MVLTCDKCGFVAKYQSILDRHTSRKKSCHPEGASSSTDGARRTKSTDQSLQCPTCLETFPNRTAKSRHVGKRTCVKVAGGSTVVSGCKNVTIVNIHLPQTQEDDVVSFVDTDIDSVVQLVLRDPARFQLAMYNGSLHQELCKATHFGPIPHNHNVYGLEAKGSKMRVHHRGKKVIMDKGHGLTRIMNNNHRIASDDKTAPYLGKHTMDRDQYSKNLISDVLHNKGDYVPVVDFYDRIPDFVPPADCLQAILDDFTKVVVAHWNFGDYDDLIPYCKRSFAHAVCHYKGQWWEATDGGGWASCGDAPEVVGRCITRLLGTTRESASRTMAETEQKHRQFYKDVVDGIDELNQRRLIQMVLGAEVAMHQYRA